MFLAIHKAAISERIEFEEFANKVTAISGSAPDEAMDFAQSVHPHFRKDAISALSEGMSFEQVSRVLTDTHLSAAWRLGLAGREFVRAVVRAPSALTTSLF